MTGDEFQAASKATSRVMNYMGILVGIVVILWIIPITLFLWGMAIRVWSW